MNRLLLDVDLQNSLPKLYEQDKNEIKTLYAKFYHPIYNWEWYPMEYSPLQRLFFGLVGSVDLEYGYFTLDELESIGVKRDYEFKPINIKDENYERIA